MVDLDTARAWDPPIEEDARKAAKWRNRERRKKEPLSLEAGYPESHEHLESEVLQPAATAEVRDAIPLQQVKAEEHKPRRAPRASRRCKALFVYTINTSGTPAALEALKRLTRRSKAIAAVAMQEHHCLPAALPDMQAQIERIGWRIATAPATYKEAGPSAGVAVATPRHVP